MAMLINKYQQLDQGYNIGPFFMFMLITITCPKKKESFVFTVVNECLVFSNMKTLVTIINLTTVLTFRLYNVLTSNGRVVIALYQQLCLHNVIDLFHDYS